MKQAKLQLPDHQPWKQLPGESDLWFSRFQRFIAMPPGTRSIVSSYQNEMARKTQPSGNYKAEASRWLWHDRAAAYDKSRSTLTLASSEANAEKFKSRLEECLAIVTEASAEALRTGKKMEDQPDKVRFALSYLDKFGNKGQGLKTLLEGHRTLFGSKHKVDVRASKLDVPIIFDEDAGP